MPRDAITPGSLIIFFDGVCGFCNGTVRFVARRDREDRFRFAPLQGELARELLLGHDADPAALDSMYVLADYGLPTESLHDRADGVIVVLSELPGFWWISILLRLVPRSLRNWAYESFVARRYQWFGKLDQCPIPEPHERKKFVDIGAGEPPDSSASQISA